MLVVLLGLLVAAAGLSAFVVRQASLFSEAADQRAFQRLAIAAHGLVAWPQVAQAIAARSLFLDPRATAAEVKERAAPPDYSFVHPRFGRVPLRYQACRPAADADADAAASGFRITAGGILLSGPSITEDPVEGPRARPAVRVRDMQDRPLANEAVCYALGPIPLSRAITVPEGFLSILLIREEMRGDKLAEVLVGQVGIETLPIRSLRDVPDLAAERAKMEEAALTAIAGVVQLDTRLASPLRTLLAADGKADVLAPVERVIAGKAYRLYPYRIEIPQANGEPTRLVLVGAMPARSGLEVANLKGARLLALGLAVATLLALAPFARLALLGPVDALRPLEVATLGLALLLLAALAAAHGSLARDVMHTTERTDAALTQSAGRIAEHVRSDLVRAASHRQSIAAAARLLPEPDPGASRATLVARLNWQALGREQIPVPESMFAIDARGRQLAGTRAVGSGLRLSGLLPFADRAYFQRALVGDVRPETAGLASAILGAVDTVPESDLQGSGFVVEHVLARDDGIPKAALAMALVEGTRLHEAGGRVLLMGFVMESMLAPSGLRPGTRFAVFDRSLPGWPVIFHSDEGRAHAELLKLSLGDADAPRIEAALARLDRDAAARCRDGGRALAAGQGLWASYVGTAYRMVARPIPCTDWAVIAFRDRAALEAEASRPTEVALVVWLGLAAFAGVLAGAAMLTARVAGVPVFHPLWPDPALASTYRNLAGWGALLVALLLAGIAAAPLASRATILCSVAAAALLLGILLKRGWRLVRFDPSRADRPPLTAGVQASWLALASAILLLLSVIPMLALVGDVRALEAESAASAAIVADAETEKRAARARILIRNNLFADRPEPLPPLEPAPACDPSAARSLVADLVALAGRPACLVPDADAPADAPLDPLRRWIARLAAAGALLLPVIGLVGLARNLFGFGVPLEAVEYPRLPDTGQSRNKPRDPPYDEAAAPERAILVAAPDPLRVRLERFARLEIDLFESRDWQALAAKLPSAAAPTNPRPLVIVHNLELLLRSDRERKEALRLLEELVRAQKRSETGGERAAYRHFRLLLLADISPLDRFLQATEFQASGGASALTDPVESIRWTRLLEGFTTYTARVRARPMPEGAEKEPEGLRYLLAELAYLPDRVVEALLPDSTPPLRPEEILEWGRPFLAGSEPAAISDFLAAQLIEHYHYLWSISSRAEQILIHRMAAGEIPSIRAAFALRSLVRRGIVVLDPAPRLMSDSFARFVRQVERPERLAIWAKDAPRGPWSRIRGNLVFVLPLVLALVAVVALRGAGGFATSLPLLLAAGPALLNMLAGRGRTG